MLIAEAKKRVTIPQLWVRLGLPGTPGTSCRCPWRPDRHPSFSVFANGTRWKDHGTGDSGDAVDFYQQVTGLAHGAACHQFLALATGSSVIQVARQPPIRRPVIPVLLPLLSRGTRRDWSELSFARAISIEAVEVAVQRGLLCFGRFRHRPAWFVTDSSGRVSQARRMDKVRWWPAGPKALTLVGGQASWPVGASEIGPFPTVLLTEGGPDLLAAFHFILLAGKVSTITAVAMLGASNEIHPAALAVLSAKTIRIIPHLDPPDKTGRHVGMEAAHRWQRQLQDSGAKLEIIDLREILPEDNLKDLNDATRLPSMNQLAVAKRLAG